MNPGVHVGTSGWTYDDWAGAFYPDGVGAAERLVFYATKFDTVEVNATFYRVPYAGMIVGWNRRLGPDFQLVVKGPRAVTHLKKLRDCDEPLRKFLDRVLELRALKVILWQLPPSLHRDTERLERFLVGLPAQVRHAVEFRHPSWWDEEVDVVLGRNRAAFVAVSHPKLPDDVRPTTDFLYVRFHGLGKRLYDHDYSCSELAPWVSRLGPHLDGRALYAFFNNDRHAKAVKNALEFRDMLA